jgi:hypothetical protein
MTNDNQLRQVSLRFFRSIAANRDQTSHSALDRMLENVLPIRFAEVVEGEVLLGNVSRIKKRSLHFRVAGPFLVAAARAF